MPGCIDWCVGGWRMNVYMCGWDDGLVGVWVGG